jgi:hypothetical protein
MPTRDPGNPAEETAAQRAGSDARAPGQGSASGASEPDPARDLGAPEDAARPGRAALPGRPVRADLLPEPARREPEGDERHRAARLPFDVETAYKPPS